MTEYIPFKMDNETDAVILIEVTSNEPSQPVYRGESQIRKTITQVGEEAKVSLSSAMENVRASALVVLSKLKEIQISERPSRIELEFGVKLDATAGAIIAQTGAEVNYTVRLTWENPKKDTKPAFRVRKRQ